MQKRKKLAQYRALAVNRYRRRSTRFIKQVSRETGPKRRRQPAGRSGVLRTLLVLLAIGTAGYLLMESGALNRIKEKLKGPAHSEKNAGVKSVKGKAAPQAALKDSTTRADSVKVAAPKKGLLERWFSKPEVKPRAVAFVRLSELYGLSEAGVVLPLKARTYYDLPIVTLPAPVFAVTGDTLAQTAVAARIAASAERLAPAFASRIAEIRVIDADGAEVIFSDSPLRARLSGRGIDNQIINLAAYLSAAGKQARGLLNMDEGNIAYLKEEE